jgi:hypothetical protein
MAWALVRASDGAIVDIQEAAPELDAPEGAAWVEGTFDREAQLGQTYVNGAVQIATPTPPPVSCSPLQARRALRAAGLIANVNAMVNAADADTKDAWEYATVIHRDNPVVLALAAQLGLSDAQVDNLFAIAQTL